MGCGDSNVVESKEYQDLSNWAGKELSAKELVEKLIPYVGEKVRIYTVMTTHLINGEIKHKGTGPNLEGPLATLCTCKHGMRSNQAPDAWKNQWVIGISSASMSKGFRGSGKHEMFYMMRVKEVFDSHKELYEYIKKNHKASLKFKDSRVNPFGDLYIPKPDCPNPNEPGGYIKPHILHDHVESWGDDIAVGPMLLGDPENTFVWTKPMIQADTGWDITNTGTRATIGDELFKLFVDAY